MNWMIRTHILVAALILIGCFSTEENNSVVDTSCSEKRSALVEPEIPVWVFEDPRDGQNYPYVQIGNLDWLAKNLNFGEMNQSKMCPQDDSSWCDHWGGYYSWAQAQVACPSGWRISTVSELNSIYLGLSNEGYYTQNSGQFGSRMKSNQYWPKCDTTDNSTGFNAYPSGALMHYANGDLTLTMHGMGAFFWGVFNDGENEHMEAYAIYAFNGGDFITPDSTTGLSVRCVRTHDYYADHIPLSSVQSSAEQSSIQQSSSSLEFSSSSFDLDPSSSTIIASSSSAFLSSSSNSLLAWYVTIGTQTWTNQNMAEQPSQGLSWCYQDNDKNCGQYGRLYDWTAAQTVCTNGWHLPSRSEWELLVQTVGPNAGNALKSREWIPVGTDSLGFAALASGFYNANYTTHFNGLGAEAYWWSATDESDPDIANYMFTSTGYAYFTLATYDKTAGMAVRCVRDD